MRAHHFPFPNWSRKKILAESKHREKRGNPTDLWVLAGLWLTTECLSIKNKSRQTLQSSECLEQLFEKHSGSGTILFLWGLIFSVFPFPCALLLRTIDMLTDTLLLRSSFTPTAGWVSTWAIWSVTGNEQMQKGQRARRKAPFDL